MNDVTWIDFCEAEDEYFVFLDAPPPPGLDSERIEAIKGERFRDVCLRLYDYHKAHPHLSQVGLENHLRENGRRTYLIAGTSRESLIRICAALPFGQQMMLSFGEQPTCDLTRELCLHTLLTRDDYRTTLKEYGHCSEEENRLLLASAGFVVPLPEATVPIKPEASPLPEHKPRGDE